jgi:hypothetical protein
MNILYEGFPVITTSARKMCEQIVTPPFHFDHLPTQVPKSPHHSKDSESAKILAHFWGVRLPRTCLSQKNPKNLIFLFESVLKLELWNIKSKKKKKNCILGHDMNRCFLPFSGQAIHTLFVGKLPC